MVISILAFHHYVHPKIVVGEMRRVLKKGGRVIISDAYEPVFWRWLLSNFKIWFFNDSGDLHFYSEKEIESLLTKNGFQDIVWKRIGSNRFLATGRQELQAGKLRAASFQDVGVKSLLG